MQVVLSEGMPYVSVSGLATLGISGLFYFASRTHGDKAKQLDSVKPVDQLQDLVGLAKSLGENGTVPVVVAATGRVNSERPLTCELTPSAEAVIREFQEDEHRWVRQPSGRDARDSHTVRHDVTESQWHLEDGSCGSDGAPLRLLIRDARNAEGLNSVMERKQAYYREQAPTSPLGAVAGTVAEAVAGLHLFVRRDGSTKTEHFLPLGAVVTVVGELARTPAAEGPGFSLMLRRPVSGPFFITKQSLGQLHANLSSTSRNYKYLALALGAVGTALVVHKLVNRLLDTYKQWQFRKRHRQVMRMGQTEQQQRTGQRQDRNIAEGDLAPNTCAVCLEHECESVFTPCGHMCCCYTCGSRLRNCPICRVKANCVRVYRAS